MNHGLASRDFQGRKRQREIIQTIIRLCIRKINHSLESEVWLAWTMAYVLCLYQPVHHHSLPDLEIPRNYIYCKTENEEGSTQAQGTMPMNKTWFNHNIWTGASETHAQLRVKHSIGTIPPNCSFSHMSSVASILCLFLPLWIKMKNKLINGKSVKAWF